MANPAGDFTAGGQLFEAYWNMFLSSLKPILWFGLAGGVLIFIYRLNFVMQESDWYYLGMWLLAKFWDAINGDPHKLFNVHSNGFVTQVRGVNLAYYPPIANAMERWESTLWKTIGTAIMCSGLAAMVYIPFAEKIGKATRKRTKERGAFITDDATLREMIEDDNKPKMKAEHRDLNQRISDLKQQGLPTEKEEQALTYMPYTFAGIPFPWRLETTHIMAMGTTGTGKSTALKDLMTQIRARGQRGVIFDLTGSFVESFYDPERDIILNPLDARCPHWSIFHDATNKLHLHSAAEALIPNNGGNGEQFWTEAARMMLVEACWTLMKNNRGSNVALYREIMTSVLPNLHALLAGTVAGPVSEPEAKRMAESVRATLNAHARAIELLPTSGRYFSIRDWVQNDDGQGGFLFISATTTHLSTLKSILTLWYDTAIYALMEMDTAQRDMRMWFMFDEMAALHRLPSLENGMRTARNFGGAFVLGVHTIQQIWSIYGREMGDTIASLARTKLFLAQPDVASAEWCSDNIGKTEWKEFKKTTTVGVERIRDGIGYSEDTEYKAIALPDEIMNLPSLSGYIKMPEGYPAAIIRLHFVPYPKKNRGFIERQLFPVQNASEAEEKAEATDPPGMEDRVEAAPAPKEVEIDASLAQDLSFQQKAAAPTLPLYDTVARDTALSPGADQNQSANPNPSPGTTPTNAAASPESREQKPKTAAAKDTSGSKRASWRAQDAREEKAKAPAETLGAKMAAQQQRQRQQKDREADIIVSRDDGHERGD